MTRPFRARTPCLVAAATLLLLAACATVPAVGTDVAVAGMPTAEMALRDAMRLVDAEMASLGTMTPGLSAADPTVPDELNRPLRFVWSGPLDEGARRLAAHIGYRVVVTPAAPAGARAIAIAVDTGPLQVTALQAFTALGNAAGTGATVQVDPQRQVVNVIHHV